MSKEPEVKIVCVKENGELNMYITIDGVRIAQRGDRDSPHAMTWIPLEPGWIVRDHNYPNGIEIEYHDVNTH